MLAKQNDGKLQYSHASATIFSVSDATIKKLLHVHVHYTIDYFFDSDEAQRGQAFIGKNQEIQPPEKQKMAIATQGIGQRSRVRI